MKFASKRKGQAFNLNGLSGFVLLIVLVGMIIGVGVLTLDKLGASIFYTGTKYNDTVTVANFSAQSLDWGNISSWVVWNGTVNVLPGGCYAINATDGHFIFENDTQEVTGDQACAVASPNFYVIYDYKNYDTKTKASMSSVSGEVSGIASDWLGLIVTVAILAIILGLVLVAFRPGMSR